MKVQRYDRAEKSALIRRVKEMLADDGFKGDLGRPDREKMALVLNAEGFRTTKGDELNYFHVGNWINVVRNPKPKERKKAAPVKTVYQRQITQASTTGIVDIIKTLAATGIDDKTLGSVVRSLV